MLIVDSSVWIQELRSERGTFDQFIALKSSHIDELAVTEPVLMEVFAGAREFERVRARMSALPIRSVDPARDYFAAAALFRAARGSGHTIRSLTDCLIAAVALRHGDAVVHRDSDFEVLAGVSNLGTVDLR